MHKSKAKTNNKTQDIVVYTKGIQDVAVRNFVKLRFSEIMKNITHYWGPPGGLYGNSKTALLSPQNIRQNKKSIIYQGDIQCG